MPAFKFRKSQRLGALAAENDGFLQEAFVDGGYLGQLLDTSDPRFLVLGRTGSGKTALLRQLAGRRDVGCIDPEDLSMQYLHNSSVLPSLVKAGVNLDVFYKHLWKHVCILELIRLRYDTEQEVPGTVSQIFDLRNIVSPTYRAKAKKRKERERRETETREAATAYLNRYGQEYWVRSDTRIKSITQELERSLEHGAKIDLGVGAAASVGGHRGTADRQRVIVSEEVVKRAQDIVSDFLISDLSKVCRLLGEHGFSDQQNARYIIIDDLDKNWMPDSEMYIGLVKALLKTVVELNRVLPGAKIVVALRDDVFARVFATRSTLEPQREKWLDLQVNVKWSRKQLVEMIDRRLEVVARHEYTKAAPKFRDLLPTEHKKKRDPDHYILDRTLLRPRDLLDFLNTCIKVQGAFQTLTWRTVRQAEQEYSARRLTALYDEWRGTYDGMQIVVNHLKSLGNGWRQTAVRDEKIDAIVSDPATARASWLAGLAEAFLRNEKSFAEVRQSILRVLYDVGILTFRIDGSHEPVTASDTLTSFRTLALEQGTLGFHKMFWAAFGLSETEQ